MTSTAFQTLRHSLATLMAKTRQRTTREATRRTLASLDTALRDDLGLTRHNQFITFQNAKHDKHSFE
ncbi:MAG: hypothetical protein KJ755_07750 [Alphaproteobacteria bacterium]|jgi:uncharacterized protein YjiS (DUF1127 family)|nr:hypothetical protein [Alphaproteobacteria bacterium]